MMEFRKHLLVGLLTSALWPQSPTLESARGTFLSMTGSRNSWTVVALQDVASPFMATVSHWDHRAWGDVCILAVQPDSLKKIQEELGVPISSEIIVVNPDGRLEQIEGNALRSFDSLWTELSLKGAIDGNAASLKFQQANLDNLDVRMLRIRHLFLRAALGKDAKDTPEVSKVRIEQACREIALLPLDWAWYQHPEAEAIVDALATTPRYTTSAETPRLILPARRKLAASLSSHLRGRPGESTLWEMWGRLLPPEDLDTAMDLPRSLPKVSGQPWPPPGPLELKETFSQAGRWDLVRALGSWGWEELRQLPPSDPKARAAAVRDWGRFYLEGAARQGQWNEVEANVESLRAFLGPVGWEQAVAAWKPSLKRAGEIPAPVLERLNQAASPVALPAAPKDPEPLLVQMAAGAVPTIDAYKKSSNLIFLPERQARWANSPDQLAAWKVMDGDHEIAAGSTSPADLERLEGTLISHRKPRILEWRELLKREPDHHLAMTSLWGALQRRLPDPRLETEWIQLSRKLGIGPDAPTWTPPTEQWAKVAASEMATMEARIGASSFDSKAWAAWVSWNRVIPTPRHVADLVGRTPRFEHYSSLSEALPINVWEAVAKDLASLKRWSDLDQWCQARMPRSTGRALSKAQSAELDLVGQYLTKARAPR